MGYFIEWPCHICERLGCWVNTRRKLKTTRLSALGVLLSQQFVRHFSGSKSWEIARPDWLLTVPVFHDTNRHVSILHLIVFVAFFQIS